MIRVVFMGTPEFAVPSLESIAKEFEVSAVFTQPDRPAGRGLRTLASPVKVKALELGIPVHQPERLGDADFDLISQFNPDFIVVVAYGQILKKRFLELPRFECVNVHSSLLPRWRGAAPIHWALLSGDRETGVTTMEMVEKLDAGGIFLQDKTSISKIDTSQSLHDRLAQMGAELIVPTLNKICAGELKSTPQDESLVTYAVKLTKEMERLNPTEPVEVLDRRVRALNPWPGTVLMTSDGKRLKVKHAVMAGDISVPCGVIQQSGNKIFLGAANGALELLELQWEGKKALNSQEFLNGLKGMGYEFPIQITSKSE